MLKLPPQRYIPMDIMDGRADRFICTLRYPIPKLSTLFPVTGKELMTFIYTQRPSLRSRDITVMIDQFAYYPNRNENIEIVIDKQ